MDEKLLFVGVSFQFEIRDSLVAQTVKICLQCKRPRFDPWIRKMPWRREWQPTPVFLPGEFPWTEKPGGLQHMGSQRVDGTEVTEHSSCSFPSRVPSGCTVGVAAVAEGLGVGSLFVFILSFLRAHTWGSGSG